MRQVTGAVFVVIMVVLFSGCSEPPEEKSDPIELSDGRAFARDSGSEWIYDGYMSLMEVNMDKTPRWENLRIEVQNVDSRGGLYPVIINLIEPTPPVREPPSGTTVPGIYYYQKPGHETERVDPLAGIKIVGMNLSFEGAECHIYLGRELLGTGSMPGEFPVPPVYITFSDVRVEPVDVTGGDLWEAAWTIVDIVPVDHQVNWSYMSLHADNQAKDLFKSRIVMEADPEVGGPYNESTHGIELLGWYTSVAGSSLIAVGDIVRLTCMDARFMDAEIELRYNSTNVKTTYLPSSF